MIKKSLEEKVNDVVNEDNEDRPEIISPIPEKGEEVEVKGGGKGTPVDLHKRVKVKIINETDKLQPPFHKHGEIVEMHPAVADKFVANGWGKLAAIFLFVAASFGAFAQGTANQQMAKIVSNLPATATAIVYSDTVTNTATNYLSTGYLPGYTNLAVYSALSAAITVPAYTTTIQWNATKISGTVAGTVTLQGSLDRTNWTTVTGTTTGVQTGAFTATNVATQATVWTLLYSPYRYYRVTWTGTGTMAAVQTAFIWVH